MFWDHLLDQIMAESKKKKPVLNDYDSYEAYAEALADWKQLPLKEEIEQLKKEIETLKEELKRLSYRPGYEPWLN